MPAVLEAEEAVEQGKYAEAAALYAVELAKVRRFTSSFIGSVFALLVLEAEQAVEQGK